MLADKQSTINGQSCLLSMLIDFRQIIDGKTTERTNKPQPRPGLVADSSYLHAARMLMRLAIALSAATAPGGSRRFVLSPTAGRAFFAASSIFSAAATGIFAGPHAGFRVLTLAAGHFGFRVFFMTAGHLSRGIFSVTTWHVFAVFGHLFAAGTCSRTGGGRVLIRNCRIGGLGPRRDRQGQNQSKHFDLHKYLQNQIRLGLAPVIKKLSC
jgi:hypothetical protein